MKKRIMIISISAVFMIALCFSVFAAFMFKKNIDGEGNTGNIEIKDKLFYNYADSTSSDMRVDSVCNISGIEYITSKNYATPSEETFQSGTTYFVEGTYVRTSVTIGGSVPSSTYFEDKDGGFSYTLDSTFQSGKAYYTKTSDEGYTATSTVSIGNIIDKSKYFVETISCNGISKISSIIDKVGKSLKFSIDDTKKIITVTDTCTLTCSINSNLGLESAIVTSSSSNAYYAVITADQTGIVVLDKNKEDEREELKDITTITCSATSNKNDSDNIYLNQLGFGFSFTNDIPVYVRIHIQDAWILTKQYSSNKKETYSVKDQISGASPFAISDDNWYYNAAENTAYLKTIVAASDVNNGELVASTYSFNVNPAYYYTPSKITAYKEFMDVQVSFTVDIVQANRAYAIWGVDPSTLK